MRRPRTLSGDEAALWQRVAATVKPINPPRDGEGDQPQAGGGGHPTASPPRSRARTIAPTTAVGGPPPRSGEDLRARANTLDASWDRRFAKGVIAPDFTLDLHGHSLDAAWGRLEHGLMLAHAQGARVVLVVTGRPRPADPADRGRQRGAIRAKLMDWLASGSHASKIAAVRGAHPRHGGAGAVYVVLRRGR